MSVDKELFLGQDGRRTVNRRIGRQRLSSYARFGSWSQNPFRVAPHFSSLCATLSMQRSYWKENTLPSNMVASLSLSLGWSGQTRLSLKTMELCLPTLKVFWTKACFFTDLGQCCRANYLTVVKTECVVWPPLALQPNRTRSGSGTSSPLSILSANTCKAMDFAFLTASSSTEP